MRIDTDFRAKQAMCDRLEFEIFVFYADFIELCTHCLTIVEGDILFSAHSDADPSQGPWVPGALRAALRLCLQATAGGALHDPFFPWHRALAPGALGSVQDTGP